MQKHQQGSAFVYPFSFEDVGDEDRHRAKLATEHGAVIRPMAACPQRYVRGHTWTHVVAQHACPTGVGQPGWLPYPVLVASGANEVMRPHSSYASQPGPDRNATLRTAPLGPGLLWQ